MGDCCKTLWDCIRACWDVSSQNKQANYQFSDLYRAVTIIAAAAAAAMTDATEIIEFNQQPVIT